MLKIKVCGLTDPVNTEEITRASPDFMGFIFYPKSKRYVGNNPENSMFRIIPARILKTGVFVNEEPSKIIEITNLYRLDLVQLHGNESVEYCKYLKNKGLIIIKAFEISNSYIFSSIKQYEKVCEYFLFDTKTGLQGGSGRKFDWEKIYEYNLNKPFFLAGGIGPEDASMVKQLNHKNLFAVDINSCFEVSPGIKDVKRVKEFIAEIKYLYDEL